MIQSHPGTPTPGFLGRIKNLLGSFFQLFPLGGANGGIIVRQKGGVAGTNEVQVSHTGTVVKVESKTGDIQIIVPSNATQTIRLLDNTGNRAAIVASGFQVGDGNSWCMGASPALVGSSTGTFFGINNAAFFLCPSGVGVPAFDGTVVGFQAITGGVMRIRDGANAGAWLQNTAGEATLANAFTDITGTLNNTNIALTVKAGRLYRIDGELVISNSVAAEGAQFDFNGGTATATNFFANFSSKAATAPVVGNEISAALATVLNYTTVTGTDYVRVGGFLKCNAGGTLVLRAAGNSHVTGTMTLGAGSWLALSDTVGV